MMKGRSFSANRVRTQSKQSVITSIARRAGLVAVLITLTVFASPPAAVHAQTLSPRAQIIVDSFGLTRTNFKGVILEEDGVLKIGGKKFEAVNGSLIETTIGVEYDLRKNTVIYQALGPAGNPNASGSGTNLNGDGSCVVGYQDSGFFTPFHSFRWTQATGPVDLGTLDVANNTGRSSFATDTSQDCSVVVGLSDIADGVTQHAFRWTPGGMIDLGVPVNGGPVSRGLGTSSDGTVVVGDADFPDPENLISGKSRKAFRWTQAGGFQSPGNLQPAGISIGTAVTADGTTVVGQASTNSGSAAFRWTLQNPIMEPIGPLPGHTRAAATAVSDNGKIVVGISHPDFLQYQGPSLGWNQGTAFRWTQATGIQDLRQVLIDNGVDVTGINLVTVTGISPDGRWIVGDATTPQTGPNETTPFIVQVCDDDIGGVCSTSSQSFLTIVKSGTGSGTVSSLPPGIDCGTACTAPFTSGSNVTLTATADASSSFTGWGPPCSGTSACTLALTADSQITAAFGPSSHSDTVQRTYIGYYQRPADPAGLVFWAGRLNTSGGNLTEIIEAFANSPESQALYGNINSGSIATVVNGIYQALFGRDAEPAGLDFYVNGFNTGQFTPATIMLNVLFGSQNEDLLSINSKLAAANLFTRTIDPELDGANFQATYAGDGDAVSARAFLAAVTEDPATLPTQDETTAYMRSNIANPGDPILNP